MHNLKPNTKYRIVPILVAIPQSLDEGEVYDGLNEMFRDQCHDGGVAMDWAFPGNLYKYPVTKTDSDPEEGELFTEKK